MLDPQYAGNIQLIRDFLDLENLSVQGRSSIGHELDQGPTWNVKTSEPFIRQYDSQPKNITADVPYAINERETLGSGKQLIRHGNPSAIAKDFSSHMAVLRRHLLPNMYFQWYLLLQGTLGGNFDIFAASDESLDWVLLWKTRSRPISVRVGPVAQHNFFSTALGPRQWTMVGCVLEGEFWTSASADYTWEWRRWDQLSMFAVKISFLWWSWRSLWSTRSTISWTSGTSWISWITAGWPEAPSPSGDGERVGTKDTPREWLHPRSAQTEPQLIPLPMSDGDDDQPPRVTRNDGNGPNRVSEYILTHKCHMNHQLNLWLFQNMMTYQISCESLITISWTTTISWTARSLQKGAPPHAPSHASQQPQPAAPPSGTQQIHPLATQGTDEDSATVEPQSRVGDRSWSPPIKKSP